MIKTKYQLKKLCEESLKGPEKINLLTSKKIEISREMYKTVTNWQLRDKFPPLLFFKERGATYLMRCA